MTAYDQLCAYTLGRGDAEFIHQHVVDAQAAQCATAASKPIGVAFALIGLYLHLERGATGKQVQQAHMRLARRRQAWPTFPLPEQRGAMTAADVMALPEEPARDAAIHAWCAGVWDAYRDSHAAVAELVAKHLP